MFLFVHRTTRLATFPDFLVIQLKKFTLREDWVPIKLDVSIEMPDVLDLSMLRASGPQPDEEMLPEINENPPPVVFDQVVLSQLADMGKTFRTRLKKLIKFIYSKNNLH